MRCSLTCVCLMVERGILREDDHKTVIRSAERKQWPLESDKRGALTSHPPPQQQEHHWLDGNVDGVTATAPTGLRRAVWKPRDWFRKAAPSRVHGYFWEQIGQNGHQGPSQIVLSCNLDHQRNFNHNELAMNLVILSSLTTSDFQSYWNHFCRCLLIKW